MNISSYQHIDNVICEVAYKLSSLPYLPLNYHEEREKFFRLPRYNPTFKYAKPSADLKSLKLQLLNLDIPTEGMGNIFHKKKQELLTIIAMMESVGNRKFSEISQKMYGVPDPLLVKRAWQLLSLQDAPDKMYLSAHQVAIHLQRAIEKYGFDWKVREKEMASKAAVDTSSKTLFIRKGAFFTRKFLNRLIVHEIGTHILRFENGANQPYKIFSLGLTDYLPTEEGLAVYNEELHSCLTRSTLKTYAARVIAVHKALRCTFRETYNYLEPYLGKDNAFEVVFRVKRGLGNTLWPGAFTKDHLYLKGYFEVKKYIEMGGEMRKLYYGKVSLQDLNNIAQMPGLINPLFFKTMKYYTEIVKCKR